MNFFKYYLFFNAVFYLAQIVIAVVEYFLDFRVGTGGSMGALIAAAIIAGKSFHSDHGRLPSKSEKWRLVIGSFLTNVSISLTLSAIALFFLAEARLLATQVVEGLGVTTLAIVMAGICLLYIVVLYFTYGFLLRKIVNKGQPPQGPDQERQEPRLS